MAADLSETQCREDFERELGEHERHLKKSLLRYLRSIQLARAEGRPIDTGDTLSRLLNASFTEPPPGSGSGAGGGGGGELAPSGAPMPTLNMTFIRQLASELVTRFSAEVKQARIEAALAQMSARYPSPHHAHCLHL